MEYKLISWNINGLNSPQKRKSTFYWLKKQKCSIISLQETHIKRTDYKFLINKKLGEEFYALSIKKKRGLVFYIKKELQPKLIAQDEGGRYLVVEVMMNYKKTLLVGIYAPNGAKDSFFKSLNQQLDQWSYDQILLMGDFNATVNNKIDRSSKDVRVEGKLPKSFFGLAKQENLIDLWRDKHVKERDYTFYSSRHSSFSRIDMIWATKDLGLVTKEIEILPKIKSDHNPIFWKGVMGKRERQWRLNEDLLTKQCNLDFLQKETQCYFKTNLDTGTNILTVWDAYKAVVRGLLITLNNKDKREKEEKFKKLQLEILNLEGELKKKPGKKQIIRQIKILQEQLNAFLNKEMEWNLKKYQQKVFESGNKPGKFLAWKMKKRRENKFINKIVTDELEVVDHEGIKREFFKYYAKLFRKVEVKEEDIDTYLSKINLPKVSQEIRLILNKEITKEEVEEAIKKAKVGKAPGPDGLSGKFYKSLSTDLIEVLQRTMNNILNLGQVPKTWNNAVVTLIPKENQVDTNVKNYRPISLLNNDYKIFAQILANRLKGFLVDYISDEQAGFLPQRQIKDNIRALLNTIEYYDKFPTKQVGLFFADAEKAFDNLNWDFMFKVMEKMDFGNQYIRAVRAIYFEQQARLRINLDLTKEFKVQKGTRQGCPLSPLIFIFVLEVLLKQVREDKEIKGLTHKGFVYKYRAFADDVMFIVEEPLKTLPKLLQIIKEFGDLAGFYINRTKSKILCKNVSKDKQKDLKVLTNCEVVTKVKYLGIDVTSKNIDLYKNNYEKLWVNIEKDLLRWNKLQLSMLGRISAIKMNVLPRMMFLFQTIPIVKEEKQFKKWQKSLSDFVWAGKKPRIKMKVLTDVKERGGFQLPNLKLYNEAVVLGWLKDWLTLSNRKLLNLEGHNNIFGWHAYLFYDKQKADGFFLHHYVRRVLFKVWQKYKILGGVRRPLWIVPAEVIMPLSDFHGEDWLTYRELVLITGENVQLKRMENIKFRYSWFQYGQIKDLFETDKRKFGFRKKNNDLEEIIFGDNVKLISKLYKWLLCWDTEDERVKLQMVKWAINVNKEITMESWEYLWKQSLKISTCNNVRENCYKMMYRWYMTPKKLAKMDNKASDRCWKCEKEMGSFYHMWWTCDKAKQYWSVIYDEMTKILKYSLPKKPELFLIGLGLEDLIPKDRTLIWYMLSAARIVYAQLWKQRDIPDIFCWIQKLIHWCEMDKMTKKLRNQEQKVFVEEWEKLKSYLENTWDMKGKCWGIDNY